MSVVLLCSVVEFRRLTGDCVNTFLGLTLYALLIFFPLLTPTVLLPLLFLKNSIFFPVDPLFMAVLLLHHGPISVLFTSNFLFVFMPFKLSIISLLFFIVSTVLFITLSLIIFELAG